jgi:hypothetical protein
MFRASIVVSFLTMSLVATAALGQIASPTITQLSMTDGKVKVMGSTVTGATSYTAEAWINGVKQTAVSSTLPSLTIAALLANTKVDFVMRAADSNGVTSAPSAVVAAVTAPLAPTGITGMPGRNSVTVSWTAAPGAASYRVTLSNGMSFTTTSTSYLITGLETATSYNCVLRSYNSGGAESVLSPVVVVKTANIATLDDEF